MMKTNLNRINKAVIREHKKNKTVAELTTFKASTAAAPAPAAVRRGERSSDDEPGARAGAAALL